MQRSNTPRPYRWMRRAIRAIAQQTQHIDRCKEEHCVSRAGYLRSTHDLDKDGTCIFCDRNPEREEGER